MGGNSFDSSLSDQPINAHGNRRRHTLPSYVREACRPLFVEDHRTRTFVHVEWYTTKLQPKAWEGVLVGYDSDKPTLRVYDHYTGRISSSRNVSFIEEPPTALPTADSGGARNRSLDFDLEPDSDFMDDYQSIKHGISSLEVSDTDATGNKQFHMRWSRSSTSQASARQQLALQCRDYLKQQFEAVSQYIGAVGMDKKKPPAIYFGTQHVRASYGLTTSGRMGSSHAQGAQ